jgi:hypothetical protein
MEKIMKNLFNLSLIISSILILSACSSGGRESRSSSGRESPQYYPDRSPKDNTDLFIISSVSSTTDLKKSGEYNLEISGVDNNITIKSNNTIKNLEISGVLNIVYIEPNTSVSNFTVSGTKNVIYVPLNSQISFIDTGIGNELKTRTTNSVVGSWSYTYPANQCKKSYLFNTNGTFSGTSLDKVFSGIYNFENTVVTDTRHSLTLTFAADNGLADCNGLSSNETGKTEITYVNFSNSDAMQVYTEITGTSDSIIFLKK